MSEAGRYRSVIKQLRRAYAGSAAVRDARVVSRWKEHVRADFLALLRAERRTRLLDIGAGTGVHGLYFQQQGLTVVCTDLAPEMVLYCQAKGLTAYEMDFLSLDFPADSFDAVWAMNSLLHVPSADLAPVLMALHQVLAPGGLFFYGVYGGFDFEGIWPNDPHVPPRFFTYYRDDRLLAAVAPYFTVVSFRPVPIEAEREQGHFQSLVLRKPDGEGNE